MLLPPLLLLIHFRAWTTVGHAIRHAIALGLHLRVAADVDINEQQLRSRTWWSLYGIEQLLGDFTGRPTAILDSDIATPLDMSPESEVIARDVRTFSTSTSAQKALLGKIPPGHRVTPYSAQQYFVSRIRLSVIGHKIRSSLYASGKTNEPWSRVQQSIREFDQELAQWSADVSEGMGLPRGIDTLTSDRLGGELLNRFELAMAYQSIRMILFRPCLCHLGGMIPRESALSQSFNQEAAVSCVSAARTLIALLPNEAALSHASKMLPWWSLLHYIAQAGAVLVLELCLKAEHMPTQVKEILADIGKVMAWLAAMAADSLSAWRSWKIFRKLALQAAAGVGIEVTIPDDIPKPPGWKPAYEQMLAQTLNVPLGQQQKLQMLSTLHQQSGMPSVSASNALFPIDGEMADEDWHLSPSIPEPNGNLTFDEGHTYPPLTDDSPGEMDWRT
jgi:Fungal specific transcription factor domain